MMKIYMKARSSGMQTVSCPTLLQIDITSYVEAQDAYKTYHADYTRVMSLCFTLSLPY